jgi:hypothetical protein
MKGTVGNKREQKGTNFILEKGIGIMSKRQYNKAEINKSNLEFILTTLLITGAENGFKYNAINDAIYNLHYLYSSILPTNKQTFVSQFNNTYSKNNGMNATFPELRERYTHEDYRDPCSYKREIRKALLYNTNTVELDITATAVYIYANFITNDDEMLNTYKQQDFYLIIPNRTRDEQKTLVQKWLQGYYNNDIVYNRIFPITGDYLKRTALVKDGLYKKNSGLFRDKEVRLLDDIMSKVQVNFHLHDGIYVTKSARKKAENAIINTYGKNVKYKTVDYSNLNPTNEELYSTLQSMDWHLDDIIETHSIVKTPIKLKGVYNNGIITHKYADNMGDVNPEIEHYLYCVSLYQKYKERQTIKLSPTIISLDRTYNRIISNL